ncbi:hypothetical protein EVAR_33031_1 [Eumeta japonica]|uniref:Regulatory protein zeste n=1 Tax=Eumeta variegata TaxID=151549 RepID=A0A4C1VRI5_EUMVA|nr:hypothetical protein EVAR_33031_1 [Eumeta japonica]
MESTSENQNRDKNCVILEYKTGAGIKNATGIIIGMSTIIRIGSQSEISWVTISATCHRGANVRFARSFGSCSRSTKMWDTIYARRSPFANAIKISTNSTIVYDFIRSFDEATAVKIKLHGDISKPYEGVQGRLQSYRKWAELANLLNSQGSGCTKTVEKWKKFWADLKSKTKKKAATLRIHSSGTGGGPPSKVKLSTIEERIMAVLGVVAYAGISEESGFPDLSDGDNHDLRAVTSDTSHVLHSIDMTHNQNLPSTSQSTPQTQLILPSRQPIHPSSPTPSTLEITEETQPILPSRQPMCPSSPTPVSQTIQNTQHVLPIPSRPSVCLPQHSHIATTQTLSASRTEESENRSPMSHMDPANRQRESRRRPDGRRRRRLPPFKSPPIRSWKLKG